MGGTGIRRPSVARRTAYSSRRSAVQAPTAGCELPAEAKHLHRHVRALALWLRRQGGRKVIQHEVRCGLGSVGLVTPHHARSRAGEMNDHDVRRLLDRVAKCRWGRLESALEAPAGRREQAGAFFGPARRGLRRVFAMPIGKRGVEARAARSAPRRGAEGAAAHISEESSCQTRNEQRGGLPLG